MKEAFAKRRFFTSAHHHFFEIREAANGRPYLLLDQSTRKGSNFESQKIVLFEDEIDGLVEILKEYKALIDSKQYKAGTSNQTKETARGAIARDGAESEDIDDSYEELDDYSEADAQMAQETDDLMEDIRSDQDDYSRSEDEGWFYKD